MSNPAPEADSKSDRDFLSEHVYGGKAALCVSIDTTQSGNPTVRLEGAVLKGENYDWKGKVALQMTRRELPLLLGVFRGTLKKFEAKGHGQANEKWMTVEDQGTKIFVSINSKTGGNRAIPIPPGDCYAILSMIQHQMKANEPHLTMGQIMENADRVCQMASRIASAG